MLSRIPLRLIAHAREKLILRADRAAAVLPELPQPQRAYSNFPNGPSTISYFIEGAALEHREFRVLVSWSRAPWPKETEGKTVLFYDACSSTYGTLQCPNLHRTSVQNRSLLQWIWHCWDLGVGTTQKWHNNRRFSITKRPFWKQTPNITNQIKLISITICYLSQIRRSNIRYKLYLWFP